jgi:hypothetical protein
MARSDLNITFGAALRHTYKTLLTVNFDTANEFGKPPETDAVTPAKMTTQTKVEKILRVMHGLASSIYQKRWLRVINIMIYKEPGNFKLEKIRVVHLFEADFNITVGILFGRRAMLENKNKSTKKCANKPHYYHIDDAINDAYILSDLRKPTQINTKTDTVQSGFEIEILPPAES